MKEQQVEAFIDTFNHTVKQNVTYEAYCIEEINFVSIYFNIWCSWYKQHIKVIIFKNCYLLEFPHASILSDFIANLKKLVIAGCNISRITRENFYGLNLLKELYIEGNYIEVLPKGLFENTPDLYIISFGNNRIKEIDSQILDPLDNIEYFDLRGNIAINILYDTINWTGIFSLQGFKNEIKKCCPNEKIKTEIRNEFEPLKTQCGDLKKEIEKLSIDNDNLKRENVAIKKENVELKKDFNILTARFEELRHDIEKLKVVENSFTRDFVVLVNGEDFQVEKELLMANSPVLDKLIRDNADADRLELKDISSETFEDILNFMQTKNPPNNAANLIELFTASARLEMKELMDSTAEILAYNITPDNADDIIKLCKKYGYEELNKKACEELKKTLPNEQTTCSYI